MQCDGSSVRSGTCFAEGLSFGLAAWHRGRTAVAVLRFRRRSRGGAIVFVERRTALAGAERR